MVPRLVVRQPTTGHGAEADLNRALDLLAEVKAGSRADMLRLYRPEPTVAFGQRDAKLPGFAAAETAARAHGFVPAVRRAGGRAAAYHRDTLIVDHIQHDGDAIAGSKSRFKYFGDMFTAALTTLGIHAGVGEIPGEYCPGEFSVFGQSVDGQRIKLVGTAQRVVSGAWLFSSVIVVADATPIRAVLRSCYSALALDWDPATAGAAEDLRPGLTVQDVEAAVLAEYAKCTELIYR